MKKTKYIHWVEYENGNYLAFGKTGSPWNQKIQIKLPKFICHFFNNIF